MVVSSAKNRTLDLTCSGSSFMWARKRMGPSSEPCGISAETGIMLELMSLVITNIVAYYIKSLLSILECRLMP